MPKKLKQTSISVVIPAYNEEKYIGECLSSLFRQTLRPLEIIVVDDGSTDDTLGFISKFQVSCLAGRRASSKFQVLRQKHQGPGKARNLGVKQAKGEILVFPDADMRLDKKYLEKIVAPILAKKAIATFTKEEYVANPENIWSACWSINAGWSENLHIDPNLFDEANNFRAILRKAFLKTKGYQDVGYGEDVTVLAQLPGVKAKKAPGAVCYHFNPSSLPEIFYSARWIGRGETIKANLRSFLTYSLLNSFRKGVLVAIRDKKPQFLIFKFVFDFGVIIGMIEKRLLGLHVK